ncbi:MAG TPA: hypothetical protein VKZ48_03225 [Burkholderiales bacterium]|nr:hypothetical protein [Burkholderiales bacterium]
MPAEPVEEEQQVKAEPVEEAKPIAAEAEETPHADVPVHEPEVSPPVAAPAAPEVHAPAATTSLPSTEELLEASGLVLIETKPGAVRPEPEVQESAPAAPRRRRERRPPPPNEPLQQLETHK